MAGVSGVLEEEILDAMSLAELHAMEETGHLKDYMDITFDSTPPHDEGQYILTQSMGGTFYITTPANWSRVPLLTSDTKTYEDIKREAPSGTQPLVVLQRADSLYFWPVPADGDSVRVYATAGTGGMYHLVEGTADPLLGWSWDNYLRFQALANLLPAGNPWEKKAEDAYKKAAQTHIQDSGAPILIDHTTRRLGF